MNNARWRIANANGELTFVEIQEGWHFCVEFDGLLVGPGMGELDCGCTCLPKDHPVYKTIPLGPPAPIELNGNRGDMNDFVAIMQQIEKHKLNEKQKR